MALSMQILIDKERYKELETNILKSKLTLLSMRLQKFLIANSSWITFKIHGIMFVYAFGLVRLYLASDSELTWYD